MVDARSVRFNPPIRPLPNVQPPRPSSGGSAYGASATAARPTGSIGQAMGLRPAPTLSPYGPYASGYRMPPSAPTTSTRTTTSPVQPPVVEPPARTPQLGDFARDFRDAEYNAQISSLDRALRDFETQAQQRAERYGQDYLQGVRNIGYRPDPSFVAMPNLLEMGREVAPSASRAVMGDEEMTPTQSMEGMWDIEGQFDPYSAAARGTRGLRDEFAARGTLRGTDFDQTFGEFQNRLSEQLDAMRTGRTRFEEDLTQEIAGQRSGTEERRQAAERAASQRAATEQMNAFMRALGGM